eukprot:gene32394-39172_t
MSRVSAGYLAGLSISSLASNAEEVADDLNTVNTEQEEAHSARPASRVLPATEVRNTYSKPHAATQTFIAQLQGGPAALQADQPMYVNIESKRKTGVSLLLNLPVLPQDSIVLLTAYCLPAFVMEEDALLGVERERRPGVDFLPISFSLRPHQADHVSSALGKSSRIVREPQTSGVVTCRPLLCNGLYTLALAGSALRGGGRWLLSLAPLASSGGAGEDSDSDYDLDLSFDSPGKPGMPGFRGAVRQQLVRVVYAVEKSPACTPLPLNRTL